jgi:hypothetical protein
MIFFQSVRIAINTYYTIMFIAADIPKDPHRKPAFGLSLAPLTRTLFEQLITFVFMIEDIPTYIPWLFKTGYTEYRIQLDHTLQYHGTLAEWQPYIRVLDDQLKKVEKESQLTPDEVSNPRKNIGRWPTPGGMLHKLKREHPTSQAIPFIEYLNSWLYRNCQAKHTLMLMALLCAEVFLIRQLQNSEKQVRFDPFSSRRAEYRPRRQRRAKSNRLGERLLKSSLHAA